MAEGLTDHVWTIKELMAFRIPIQWYEYTTQIGLSLNSLTYLSSLFAILETSEA